MDQFLGYHSEWNLGSPGGWDYQRITQKIGRTIWDTHFKKFCSDIELDFEHPLLIPVHSFVTMLQNAHRLREGSNPGFIAVVAEEETLQDVVENINLVTHLNAIDGLSSAIMAPHELEIKNGRVCFLGKSISIIFMDFNTNVLLDLHRKQNLDALLQAVREGRVINPRGTEPINSKSMFEIITDIQKNKYFHQETVEKTPWTRQFYPRKTKGPKGEDIKELIEWTHKNWQNLVLKPERGYSGKGVKVGGIHNDIDNIISLALNKGDYIVQEKIPLNLWAEYIPELDTEKHVVNKAQYQTDFRCLFGKNCLYGFLGRYGGVPTNVGSGGGMQPLAVVDSSISIKDATEEINDAICKINYNDVFDALQHQQQIAIENKFTYLLGPIKIALRPRLINKNHIGDLTKYCANIWSDCLTMEKMWLADELDLIIKIDPDELEIIKSQPWKGQPAIFASDGLFSFGAHL